VAGLYRDPVYGARIFYAEWDPGGPRRLDVITHVAARDRSVLIDEDPASQDPPQDPEIAMFLKPSASMPTDGIVLDKAREITQCTHTPLQRARAIYEWIVENTFRDPKVKACGKGDIKVMLETGYLGGKCADINSLFVGLARASGLPAREVYGIRVAESAQFKSLGKQEDITQAQHCRAEFYLYPFGWVPVDPADVRKVVLEEHLPLSDERVAALRERLFGFWEMNWIAYNHARDFGLTPPAHKVMTFFMYPHAELITTPGEVSEPSEPFYTISAREVPAEELGRPFPRV
jgi:transglutaminase-like putative cysteine protease